MHGDDVYDGFGGCEVNDDDDEFVDPQRPYQTFAQIYDAAMTGVPYQQWIDYVEGLLRRHAIKARDVLDLACGTGNTSLPWVQRGYRVTGVDRSQDMLSIAEEKARRQGLRVRYIQQDMRQLNLQTTFDVVTCLYDSMNYLMKEADLGTVFTRVFPHVRPFGAFVFDMNSRKKLESIREDTIHIQGKGWNLIWDERFVRAFDLWEVELTGFIELADQPGLYRKFEEVHQERGYPIDRVRELLAAAGFGPVTAYRAFTHNAATESANRIYYVAEKRGGGRQDTA